MPTLVYGSPRVSTHVALRVYTEPKRKAEQKKLIESSDYFFLFTMVILFMIKYIFFDTVTHTFFLSDYCYHYYWQYNFIIIPPKEGSLVFRTLLFLLIMLFYLL
jgi:hypothetical protein